MLKLTHIRQTIIHLKYLQISSMLELIQAAIIHLKINLFTVTKQSLQ